MDATRLVSAVTSGIPVKTILNPQDNCALSMGAFGHIAYRLYLHGNIDISVSGGAVNQEQTMLVMIQQAPAGGAEVTWPDDIIWADNKFPFVDSQANAITFARIMTLDGGKRYYGRAGF